MRSMLLAMFLVTSMSCQTIEEGWQGIKPLEANRIMIEKLYEKGKPRDTGEYVYRMEAG